MSDREGRSWARLFALVGMTILSMGWTASCDRPAASEERRGPAAEEEPEGWSQILISFQGALNSRSDRPREEARQLANELLGRARRGSPFERLARTYSDHPSGVRGGRVDDPKGTPPQIDRVVDHLKAGEVGPAVIETAEGFHVVRRDQ